ncbi:PD-(D/E)XK nuclease family protein [Candidatus Nomurabacteria bacterium]|nr:PD-(D/E)XK nuclease family protein [Candidatus Nomurabacteria bacterium]
MKKEFDYYRNLQQTHPSIKKMGLEFIPYKHKDFFDWRGDEEGNYYGFGFEHAPTRIELCGKIDDVWRDDNGTLYIVDYKAVATSDSYKLTMEYKYNQGYKRQIEVYQWIFRQNGFNVSDTGYIVFVNAQTDPDYFDNKLEFLLSIEEVRGDCFWVEKELENIRACIDKTSIPESSQDCDICQYYNKRLMATNHK